MSKLKKALVAVVLIGTIGFGIYEARRAADLDNLNQRLIADNKQTTAKRELAITQAAARDDELKRWREEHSELVRLRGEVSQLRQIQKELADLKKAQQALPPKSSPAAPADANSSPNSAPEPGPEAALLPRESWAFAGYATPGNALQSIVWAMKNGDVQTFLGSLTPEARESAAKQFEGKPDNEIAAALQSEVKDLLGLRFDRVKNVSETETTFVLNSEEKDDGVTRFRSEAVAIFKNIQGQWKCTGF